MIFVMLGAMFIHDTYNIFEYGRPSYVISTFIVCVFIDNVKSLVSLALIYCIVVRRFMYLEVNEHEYTDPNAEKVPKRENAIPKLKIFCLKFLESAPVESVSLIVIAIYAIFVLFWLVHEEFTGENFKKVDDRIMSSIDQVFLIIFLIEIILKSFASNAMYLYDGFNLFDAFIVILSFILNMVGIIIKGLSVLRLIRVVVIIVRKISGQQSKLRHNQKMNNPVESVIKILEAITEEEEVSGNIKKEAKWAIDLIESNKLYELNFDMTQD